MSHRIANRRINFDSKDLLHTAHGVFELEDDSDLYNRIDKAIRCLRAVVPRINNKAPTDCPWLVPNMECTNPQEVWLLIQSSEILQAEIENGASFLVLQQFIDIDPKMEFYGYLYNGRLIAICQKHTDVWFEYDDCFLENVKVGILNYFTCTANNAFDIGSCCIHVVADSNLAFRIIKSTGWINFGLFTKFELENIKDDIVFKVVSHPNGISLKPRNHYFPHDVKNVGSASEIVKVLNNIEKVTLE